MNDDDVKRLLGDRPGRDLPPGAIERIDRAMKNAGDEAARRREHAWWRREMPRWQALAACIAISAIVGLVTRAATVSGVAAPVADNRGPVVEPSPGTPESQSPPPRRRIATDISRWTVLEIRKPSGA